MNEEETLKLFDLSKVRGRDKLSKVLSCRVTQADFKWIVEKRISATKLFNYFLHKIMEKEKKKELMQKAK